MKKFLSLLLASTVLTGCSMYSVDESENNEEQTEETAEESQEIDFVLQESDKYAQVSPINDEALRVLSDFVLESDAEVGVAGELSLDYSGVYLSGEEEIFGVYLITNRTNMDMENIQVNVTHETSNGETVLEAHPLYLGGEMFGLLEQNTAMPVYIEMDEEDAQALEGDSFENSEITLTSLNFDATEDLIDDQTEDEAEETDEESEDSGVPEGYNAGYNPAFVLAMRQQEQLLSDIEAGNVPELDVQSPPIIVNGIQGGELLNIIQAEEIVNPASGFSQEGALTLFWTGVTTGEYESTIFYVANRTGEDLSDFDITMTFETSDGGTILDEETITLSASDYGTLPNNGLLPILVDIPADGRTELAKLLDPQSGVSPEYYIVEDGENEETTE